MRYLFAVALFAGGFEALSAAWLNAPNVAGQVVAGVAAAVFLGCAWAMRSRGSFAAASVITVLLLVDVAGVPFYEKSSAADWLVQLGFGVIGLLGLIAWVSLLRGRRRPPVAAQA